MEATLQQLVMQQTGTISDEKWNMQQTGTISDEKWNSLRTIDELDSALQAVIQKHFPQEKK